MGVDILNQVQVNARGTESLMLRQAFGKNLALWRGAADCRQTLTFGKPQDVARKAEADLRAFSPGGGYIFAAVHNIQAGALRRISSRCSKPPTASKLGCSVREEHGEWTCHLSASI